MFILKINNRVFPIKTQKMAHHRSKHFALTRLFGNTMIDIFSSATLTCCSITKTKYTNESQAVYTKTSGQVSHIWPTKKVSGTRKYTGNLPLLDLNLYHHTGDILFRSFFL
jgi:hypothetical protein